jgi:hypothetical protein
MDLKVLVLPVMLLLSKKVDLSDPEILHYVKIGFITGRNIIKYQVKIIFIESYTLPAFFFCFQLQP